MIAGVIANRALCQDCLAPNVDPGFWVDAFCLCGGELCGCYLCRETLNRLFSGERDGRELGLQRPANAHGWTPEKGLRCQ